MLGFLPTLITLINNTKTTKQLITKHCGLVGIDFLLWLVCPYFLWLVSWFLVSVSDFHIWLCFYSWCRSCQTSNRRTHCGALCQENPVNRWFSTSGIITWTASLTLWRSFGTSAAGKRRQLLANT